MLGLRKRSSLLLKNRNANGIKLIAPAIINIQKAARGPEKLVISGSIRKKNVAQAWSTWRLSAA